eukprot:5541710-Alexandrium_andersonii.AAC.1
MDTEIDLLQQWEAVWEVINPLGASEAEVVRFPQRLRVIGPDSLKGAEEVLDLEPNLPADLLDFRGSFYDLPSEIDLA